MLIVARKVKRIRPKQKINIKASSNLNFFPIETVEKIKAIIAE
jgi:hypothetical protein